MLGRLNHVAIAVPDLAGGNGVYRDALGAKVSDPQALPEHGVTTVFVTSPTPSWSFWNHWARIRRSRLSLNGTHRAACTTSATRSRT